MIIYVNGFDEAKNYPVMFNSSDVFFDNSRDRFYCKAVDQTGKPSVTTYEFHQVENEKPLTADNFVPREQFDALNAKLDNLMMLLSQSTTPSPQPVAEIPPATSPAPATNRRQTQSQVNKEVVNNAK